MPRSADSNFARRGWANPSFSRPAWAAVLRRAVVVTSFPPFLQLYRGLYRLAIRLAVASLRTSPAVKAVYLRGGCAQDRIIPGITDIDIVVFADVSPGADTGYLRKYQRIAALLPILETWPDVYDAATPQAEYDGRPRLQFQLAAGDQSWKLLYGEDLLAQLPLRRGSALHLGLLCGAGMTFGKFARYAWFGERAPADRVLVASLCYRCVAGVLQMELSVARHDPLPDREAALSAAQAELSEEASFIQELRRLDTTHYLRPEPRLEERTSAFLFRRLDALLGRLSAGAFSQPAPGSSVPVRHQAEGTLSELHLTPTEAAAIERAIHVAREEWGSAYRATYLAPTVFHSIGDLVLALEVDPERTPTPEQLRRLVGALKGNVVSPLRQIMPYLLLEHGAVHVGEALLLARVERLLHPAAHPDFFALLRLPGFRLDGVGAPPELPPVITAVLREGLRESVWRLLYPGLAPGRPLPERLDEAALFWKQLQVALVERSLSGGTVRYPVTTAAVEQQLGEIGIQLPSELAPLREAALHPNALLRATELHAEANDFVRKVILVLRDLPGLDPPAPRQERGGRQQRESN